MKFKLINESINKTDKHDANTLSLVFTKRQFLQKKGYQKLNFVSCKSKDLRADLLHRKIGSSHSEEREIKNTTISLKKPGTLYYIRKWY